MDIKNKYTFFFLVLFFSGSVVLMSVRDLRRHVRASRAQSVDMKEIVRVLQGDTLQQHRFEAGKFKDPKTGSARAPGQILASEDKKWLKGVVRGVLSSTEDK